MTIAGTVVTMGGDTENLVDVRIYFTGRINRNSSPKHVVGFSIFPMYINRRLAREIIFLEMRLVAQNLAQPY